MSNNEAYLSNIMTAIMLILSIVLAFFMLRPFLYPIIGGLLLVFIFAPVYDKLNKIIKSKNVLAVLLSLIIVFLITIPIVILTPVAVEEAIKIFTASQDIDIFETIREFFPSLFGSEELASEISSIFNTFITGLTRQLISLVSTFLLNLPMLLLQFFVAMLTFFFVIRDKDEFVKSVKNLLPFPKDVGEKITKATREVTSSILYGQVIIGIIQGIVASLAFFLFRVPNPLIFTGLVVAAGILPAVGPMFVSLPLALYLFVSGNVFPAIGVLIFGGVASVIDNILRPIIVSRKIKMNELIILIGMVGGLLFFGILGIILGPLIIAYLIIFLEIYKNKKLSGFFITREKS